MARLKRAMALRAHRAYVAFRTATVARLPRPVIEALKRVRDLPAWLGHARRSSAAARLEAARHEAEGLGVRPLISLVMPTYKTEQRYLREALDSVIAQLYAEWELIVVDDGSEDDRLKATMESYAAAEPRIRFEPLAANAGISAATNAGLALCRGEYVGFLDHDDVLTPDALLRVAQTLAADPELDVVYSDSDKLNGHGVRADPFLKPDWSPVYALGAMYIGHLLVLRRALAEEVGGFDSAFDKIQDFEFMLRVSERTDRIGHIPQVLYHWRAIPGGIAAGAEEKSGVPELQARAVSAHLERRGVDVVAVAHPAIPHRAVLAPRNGGPEARVSVVIAAPEGGPALARLLGSLLDGPARPPAETIVVTGSGVDPGRGDVTVVAAPPAPFNRAAHNNAGARAASGSHLVFLAEECEVVDPDWLACLLLPTAIPGVGAAGPLLVRPDDRVEQAGLAIGLDGVVSPMSAGADGEGDGYYGSLPCAHEVSALSAECLLVGREDFEAIGGFNELYSIQFEDFDLCQRLARRGLASVYAARPRVLSHRSPATRKAQTDIVDRALFVDCWYDELLRGDPYFNAAFSRERADYSPAGWRERVYRAAAPTGRR